MTDEAVLKVEGHVFNLLFTSRKYKCKVLSRTNHAVFTLLNDFWPLVFTHSINADCNPVTCVFSGNFPNIIINQSSFEISGGIFSNNNNKVHITPQIVKTHKINEIKWEKINYGSLNVLKNWLLSQTTGGIADALRGADDLMSKKIRSFIKMLKASWDTGNENEFYITLTEMAGLGIGLTPSTDDFICGLLLSTNILLNSSLIHPKWKIPAKKIINITKPKTTLLSWHYIKLASQGIISDRQKDLFEKLGSDLILNKEYLDEINYGHTSFADFLAGNLFVLC